MKIQSIKSVRSIALDNIFTGKKVNTRRGLSRFQSKLEQETGANRFNPRTLNYNPFTKEMEIQKNSRITFVRKNKSGYHAVGLGQIAASNFEEVKSTLREKGFSGVRMGGLVFKL
jgi:hypothetical protein